MTTTPWLDGLRVASLYTFAVTAPLLQVLQASPTFFVAHRVSRSGLLAVLALVCVLLPLLLAAVATAFRWLLLPMVATLAGIAALGWLHTAAVPAGLSVALAAATGALFARAYRRWEGVRFFVTCLSAGLIAVPCRLALGAPVLPPPALEATPTPAAPKGPERPPVVMLVLDELPLASLLATATASGHGSSSPPSARARPGRDGARRLS